jgi:hypothetical protein
MGGRVAHPPIKIEIAATAATFVMLIRDISGRRHAYAMRNAEILRLVSWFLMGGCGAVHQSKPPREKIVLD